MAVDDFLLTYRCYMSALDLSNLLMECLRESFSQVEVMIGLQQRIRIYAFLQEWTKTCWDEDINDKKEVLASLVDGMDDALWSDPKLLNPADKQLLWKMRQTLDKADAKSNALKFENSVKSDTSSLHSSVKSSSLKSSKSSNNLLNRIKERVLPKASPPKVVRSYVDVTDILLSVEVDILARHLCLIELDLLRRVRWDDFLIKHFTTHIDKPDHQTESEPYKRFNQVSKWAKRQLQQDDCRWRASRLIRIALVTTIIQAACFFLFCFRAL